MKSVSCGGILLSSLLLLVHNHSLDLCEAAARPASFGTSRIIKNAQTLTIVSIRGGTTKVPNIIQPSSTMSEEQPPPSKKTKLLKLTYFDIEGAAEPMYVL